MDFEWASNFYFTEDILRELLSNCNTIPFAVYNSDAQVLLTHGFQEIVWTRFGCDLDAIWTPFGRDLDLQVVGL